jgi:aspartate kinase
MGSVPKPGAGFEAEIDRDCDWLRSYLFAAQVRCTLVSDHKFVCGYQAIDEISPHSQDSIVGFGERLGCNL